MIDYFKGDAVPVEYMNAINENHGKSEVCRMPQTHLI